MHFLKASVRRRWTLTILGLSLTIQSRTVLQLHLTLFPGALKGMVLEQDFWEGRRCVSLINITFLEPGAKTC